MTGKRGTAYLHCVCDICIGACIHIRLLKVARMRPEHHMQKPKDSRKQATTPDELRFQIRCHQEHFLAPQTPHMPTSPALMYIFSMQVELLHDQLFVTNSGLRTFPHTMQVRAVGSLITEQIGQFPAITDDPSTTRLAFSFLLVEVCVGVTLCLPLSRIGLD